MAVLDVPLPVHRLPSSIRCVRRILPTAACSIPAQALRDPSVAAWVGAHGVAVNGCDDGDLDLIGATGIRPEHVVVRCGAATPTIRRALEAGVRRFIVSTDRHVDVLATSGYHDVSVFLHDRGPAVIGERRLDVIGLHCDVDDSTGILEWGLAAEQMLCRMSTYRTCGLQLSRISLSGGTSAEWIYGRETSRAVATAIDDAVTEGCARWRLPRPAVLVGPQRT